MSLDKTTSILEDNNIQYFIINEKNNTKFLIKPYPKTKDVIRNSPYMIKNQN